MTLRSTDIPFDGHSRAVKDRHFTNPGEHAYRFELQPVGIVFELDRLRRSSQELWGELIVRVNGSFPNARTFDANVLQVGDWNLSSVNARSTRAKLLAERAGEGEMDWLGLLEEFAVKVIAAERQGDPVVALRDVPTPVDRRDIWTVEGFPLLVDDPMVLFGDPACGKSYIAIWVATVLAERGIPVLYVDWEGSKDEQRRRFERLSAPMSSLVYYLHRDRPLIRVIDGVTQVIRDKGIKYVICDSIGFALDGSPIDAEPATQYFAMTRRFGCGSLHLAHSPKHVEEGQQATIFGSQFFKAGARSAWFIDRAADNTEDEIRLGLYHRKYNGGRLSQPLNYRIKFEHGRTRIEPIEAAEVEELSANLPLIDRMRTALEDRPLKVKQIADDLAVTPNVVRALVSRHKSVFIRVGDRIATAQTREVGF